MKQAKLGVAIKTSQSGAVYNHEVRFNIKRMNKS